MGKLKKFGEFNTINENSVDNSYWNGTGKHQEEYDKLYSKLVPSSGSSETLNGELLRAASRLYHENFNNGNCNAKSDNREYCSHCSGSGEVEEESYDDEEEAGYTECPECWGEGKVEETAEISEFYDKFLTLIENNIPEARKTIDTIKNIILSGNDNNYVYDTLIDQVVEYVKNNEDKPLPERYHRD